MVQVSAAQWFNLSATERKLARSLGISPKEPGSTARARPIVRPKPYLLQARIHCYLCESNTKQYFHMVLDEDQYLQPYLRSDKITEKKAQRLQKEMSLRSQDIKVSTCAACPEALGKWKKEELVKKLMQVFPVARAMAITGGKPWIVR